MSGVSLAGRVASTRLRVELMPAGGVCRLGQGEAEVRGRSVREDGENAPSPVLLAAFSCGR